jgi:hypothetical protein
MIHGDIEADWKEVLTAKDKQDLNEKKGIESAVVLFSTPF